VGRVREEKRRREKIREEKEPEKEESLERARFKTWNRNGGFAPLMAWKKVVLEVIALLGLAIRGQVLCLAIFFAALVATFRQCMTVTVHFVRSARKLKMVVLVIVPSPIITTTHPHNMRATSKANSSSLQRFRFH